MDPEIQFRKMDPIRLFSAAAGLMSGKTDLQKLKEMERR